MFGMLIEPYAVTRKYKPPVDGFRCWSLRYYPHRERRRRETPHRHRVLRVWVAGRG